MGYSSPRVGSVKKKVLVLLSAGLALGLTHSYRKQAWIWKQIPKEFEKINRQALERAIKSLYTSHLIGEKEHADGSTVFVLSNLGKRKILKFNIEKIKVLKPKKWDRKWRVVMFDIPEKNRHLREAIRFHFKKMGLVEYQKSVFVSPYPCKKEIEFILEYYNARRFIRFIIAQSIDNELHFKKKFNLS